MRCVGQKTGVRFTNVEGDLRYCFAVYGEFWGKLDESSPKILDGLLTRRCWRSILLSRSLFLAHALGGDRFRADRLSDIPLGSLMRVAQSRDRDGGKKNGRKNS